MRIRKIITIYLFPSLLCFLISCNQQLKEKPLNEKLKSTVYEEFSLSNKLYLLAPEFNSKTCESFGECDCCTSNYVFLDSENFISVDYCLEADTYYSGKYKIDNEKVELKYNALVVQKEYNWDSETDSTNTEPEYKFKTEKCKSFQSTWVKLNCKRKIYFKTLDEKTQYVSIDKSKTSQNFLIELKKEGIIEKLFIK